MITDNNSLFTEVSTIGDLLVRACACHPHRDAIVFPDERRTYAQLWEGAVAAARGLAALGISPGDHVGLFMGNEPQFAEALFGIALLGCVAVPLNTRHKATELRFIIANARLVAILTSGLHTDYVNLPQVLRDAIGSEGDMPDLRIVVTLGGEKSPGFMDAAAFAQRGATTPPERIEALRRRVRVRDPGLILYTSGTTAHPKGCVLTHEAVTRGPVERARYRLSAPGLSVPGLSVPGLSVPGPNVTWAAGPLFHIGSLAPFLGSIGVMGTFLSDRYFEPGRAITLMRREGVTLAWPWFSAIVQGIIDHPDFDPGAFKSLRHLFLIAPESVVERVQGLFPQTEILQACGMTETGGVFALSTPDETPRSRSTTQGKAAPGIDVRIVDPGTSGDCEAGRMGEIWVRGYCVMEGYYGAPEQTGAALTADGWLKTGDLYSRTEDGSLVFCGRLKDMIKVGGENVATMEVEAFLCSHPAVKIAEVIGAPDPRLDEVPVAFVEVHGSADVTPEALIDFCRGRIASYKIPRAVYFMKSDAWPMSATKVDKRALRDLVGKK